MVLIVWKTAAPATLRHLFAGTNPLVSKDVSHRSASSLVMATSSKGKWLDACMTTPTEQHGTAAKTLKYWSGVQCQTRGLFGQCRTRGLAVTKQDLKPGLSNPFWVPSAGYVEYPPNIVFDTEISGGIPSAKVITIKGVPEKDCQNITVTLETTREEDADIHFHMKAGFKDQALYINRRINGQFDKDAKVHKTRFPFSPGEPFTLSIHVSPAEFKLVINNVNIDTFKHNITRNVRQVSYFRVFGKLDVTQYILE